MHAMFHVRKCDSFEKLLSVEEAFLSKKRGDNLNIRKLELCFLSTALPLCCSIYILCYYVISTIILFEKIPEQSFVWTD